MDSCRISASGFATSPKKAVSQPESRLQPSRMHKLQFRVDCLRYISQSCLHDLCTPCNYSTESSRAQRYPTSCSLSLIHSPSVRWYTRVYRFLECGIGLTLTPNRRLLETRLGERFLIERERERDKPVACRSWMDMSGTRDVFQ